jgi:hypothetical protein
MNLSRSKHRFNPTSALIVFGLFATLLVAMFRPSGATASLPVSAIVFKNADDNTGSTVKFSDLTPITANYDVIFKNHKGSNKVALKGIPLIDFLKAADVNTGDVQFVKVRIGQTNDSVVSLQPLSQESSAGRPPLILDSGKSPYTGTLKSPQIIPGQPSATPIKEEWFAPFNRKTEGLTIIPGEPGASILSVSIKSKKLKDGQIKLTGEASGNKTKSLKWEWYQFDAKGNSSVKCNSQSCTTTDATDASSGSHQLNVVVTDSKGSTGAGSYGYTSKKPSKDKGKTSDPDKGSGSTGNTGSDTTGNGGGGAPGSTYIPPATNAAPPQNSVPPVTTTPTPTPAPAPAQTGVDSSAITNVAQNVNGSGNLTTVSGVLLSTPTVAAAGGAGGAPISALPAPVADQLNSIFQPVDSPDDIWPYLLAVLFALTLSGAVREWVNP